MTLRMPNLLITTAFIAGLAALPLAPVALAAGEHGGGHGHGQTTKIGRPGDASQVTRTVEVTMYDNYYEPESVEVREGETVRFVVNNEGEFLHVDRRGMLTP